MQAVQRQTELKINDPQPTTTKIIISNTKGYHFIDTATIIHVRADSNYCLIYLVNGDTIYCSKTLKSIHAKLDKNNFVRAHNSIVVNWRMISYINSSCTEATLQGGAIVPISRSRRKRIKSLLEKI